MAIINGKKVLSVVKTKVISAAGTININANGIYDVNNYQTANVNVGNIQGLLFYFANDITFTSTTNDLTIDFSNSQATFNDSSTELNITLPVLSGTGVALITI